MKTFSLGRRLLFLMIMSLIRSFPLCFALQWRADFFDIQFSNYGSPDNSGSLILGCFVDRQHLLLGRSRPIFLPGSSSVRREKIIVGILFSPTVCAKFDTNILPDK